MYEQSSVKVFLSLRRLSSLPQLTVGIAHTHKNPKDELYHCATFQKLPGSNQRGKIAHFTNKVEVKTCFLTEGILSFLSVFSLLKASALCFRELSVGTY